MKKLSEKRWLMVLGIILAQLGLGTIYTWSRRINGPAKKNPPP